MSSHHGTSMSIATEPTSVQLYPLPTRRGRGLVQEKLEREGRIPNRKNGIALRIRHRTWFPRKTNIGATTEMNVSTTPGPGKSTEMVVPKISSHDLGTHTIF